MAAVQDDDSVTRLHVAQLLDEMDFRSAGAVVRSAVASPDPELNLLGVRAIGLAGGAEDVQFLLDAADKSADPLIRAEVAWALGRIGCRATVGPLIAMLPSPTTACATRRRTHLTMRRCACFGRPGPAALSSNGGERRDRVAS